MGCEQSAPVVVDNGKKGDEATTVSSSVCCSARAKSGFTYRKNTCALEYWEPLRLLGEGSISSIHLVRRRPHRINVPYKERADIMRVADSISSSPNNNNNNNNNNNEAEEKMYANELFALKSIMKDHVRNDTYLEEMRSEIYTMSRLCHSNIVSVVEAFERKRHIYLIMEHCRGGDMCERKPTEAEAAFIIRKVLLAVAYMHQHNVVHRYVNRMKYQMLVNVLDCENKASFGILTRI
jgi:serine/threonine protein kinase